MTFSAKCTEVLWSLCASIWGCLLETTIRSLQKQQNRVERIVANKPYDDSATSMLKELGWPYVKDITFKETSIVTFKALRHDLWTLYLSDLFQNLTQVHRRELRNSQVGLRVV